jgi:hypothetical protein
VADQRPEIPESHSFVPQTVAETLSPLAKDMFDNAAQDEKARRLDLMLLGAHPTITVGIPGYARCSVHMLRSPNFVPEEAQIGQVVSMGTGSVFNRLNTDSGEVQCDFATNAAPNGRLIATDDSLFAFLGDEIFASFDLSLKKLRWSVEASKEWTSARPYLWHGNVLAGNRRELVAFAAADGTRVWSHQFPETVRGIGTSDEVLYVGSLSGPVFAYSPKP